MKNAEIKNLTIEELKERTSAEELNLVKMKFAHTVSPLENPNQLKDVRKLLARLKTEINARLKQ